MKNDWVRSLEKQVNEIRRRTNPNYKTWCHCTGSRWTKSASEPHRSYNNKDNDDEFRNKIAFFNILYHIFGTREVTFKSSNYTQSALFKACYDEPQSPGALKLQANMY